MAASDYSTLADYRAWKQYTSDDTSDDALIAALIPDISRAIDDHCHRWFYPRTLTITYDFQDAHKLMLRDDLQSITTLTHGNAESMPTTDYFLYPLNGPPYRWIEINKTYGRVFRWNNTTQQAITITGIWGFLENGTTPGRIRLALHAWMNYLITAIRNAGIQSTTIGDYTVSYGAALSELSKGPPVEANNILAHFKKSSIGSNSMW